MSYRPTIKNSDSGSLTDLALDAETVQGYKPCINVVTLEDNGSTTAGTWLAKSSKISSLVDGQLYLYKITVAGASTTTLNITGSGGTALGAKTVYRTGTTKLTTQYGVGHYILLVYNSLNTAFRVLNDYDANSYAYVRQYQHGDNAAGTTNLYPILTRYNLTNKNASYDTAYSRFHTGTYIDMTNGYLYAPKVYSGGSEVALKTDIPAAVTESTVSGWGFTKNAGTVTSVSAGTGLSISGTASVNPTVNIADGYKIFKTVTIREESGTKRIYLWDMADDTDNVYYVPKDPDGYSYGVYGYDTSKSLGSFSGPGILLIKKLGTTILWYKYIGCYQETLYGIAKVSSAYGQEYGTSAALLETPGFGYSGFSGIGSSTKPVYVAYTNDANSPACTITECSTYAGGTKVTLNGTDKGAASASIYAPTSSGSSGQLLQSNGNATAPTWTTVTIPTKSSWNYDDMYVKYSASQSLTDAQKTQARSNIGAGTSNFTGYTSSNKLSTDYINNTAGWTSNAGTVTSVRVQAGTGLASSTSTAQTATLNTTISIASGYKLPTTTEWSSKADASALGDQVTYSFSGGTLTITSK